MLEGAVIRSAPSVDESTVQCQKCLLAGDSVTVECWVVGETYSETNVTSDRWAHITGPQEGYVADLFIDTPKLPDGTPSYDECPS